MRSLAYTCPLCFCLVEEKQGEELLSINWGVTPCQPHSVAPQKTAFFIVAAAKT
jgi:hypothetical protein